MAAGIMQKRYLLQVATSLFGLIADHTSDGHHREEIGYAKGMAQEGCEGFDILEEQMATTHT